MKTVTIYSTPTCGFCKQLKAYLGEKNVSYIDHDVTTDDAAREKMQSLTGGGMSVPVIVFNDGQSDQEVQIGFDLVKVQTTLGL